MNRLIFFRALLATFPLLLILSSCSLAYIIPNKTDQVANIQKPRVLFFTDAENLDKESPYYDAVLELKNQYPNEMAKMIVKEDRKGWKNEVDEVPAILLVNEEKVIVKVEGNVRNKEDILSPFCHALDQVKTN
ncbi:hypothetical protein [Bacillus sp. NPDC077027]|uniref:hypothetical protein n=1 Tax=Bacillus sp. NPDC077027 TaxID=3390548 RepID=UPI003D064D36